MENSVKVLRVCLSFDEAKQHVGEDYLSGSGRRRWIEGPVPMHDDRQYITIREDAWKPKKLFPRLVPDGQYTTIREDVWRPTLFPSDRFDSFIG